MILNRTFITPKTTGRERCDEHMTYNVGTKFEGQDKCVEKFGHDGYHHNGKGLGWGDPIRPIDWLHGKSWYSSVWQAFLSWGSWD